MASILSTHHTLVAAYFPSVIDECTSSFRDIEKGVLSVCAWLILHALARVLVDSTVCFCATAVAAQTEDLDAMSNELVSIKKKAEAAALVLDEVMNRGSDLIESYKIARSDITLGEARQPTYFLFAMV